MQIFIMVSITHIIISTAKICFCRTIDIFSPAIVQETVSQTETNPISEVQQMGLSSLNFAALRAFQKSVVRIHNQLNVSRSP
jgi:hypothetical protein